jgi:DNA repair exonuclease SbcCD nuclease subunit
VRLFHAADVHLYSPRRGLSRLGDDDLARRLWLASREALANLVDLAVAERAPLLLAGDVYDGDWHDYSTGRFFVRQMDRLHDEGLRVFMVAGNHDAASEISRNLRLPPNVTVMDTAHPQSVADDDLGLVVHGQGFATKAVMQNLATEFPHRVPGMMNVGLLHTSVDGVEGHARYAPCRVEDLTARGYDYFALGHVHQRTVLIDGEHPVAYSGNLQGRHPRESGAKGALLVDLDPKAGTSIEFHALDVARWAVVEVAADTCGGLDDVLAETEQCLRGAVAEAGGRPVVARVVFIGRTPAAGELMDTVRVREEVDRIAIGLGAAVEKVRVRVSPPTVADAGDDELRAAVLAAAMARPRLAFGRIYAIWTPRWGWRSARLGWSTSEMPKPGATWRGRRRPRSGRSSPRWWRDETGRARPGALWRVQRCVHPVRPWADRGRRAERVRQVHRPDGPGRPVVGYAAAPSVGGGGGPERASARRAAGARRRAARRPAAPYRSGVVRRVRAADGGQPVGC